MARPKLTTFIAIVLAVLWSGALGLLHVNGDTSFLDRIEAALVDLRMLVRGPIKPPADVALVLIDDATVRIDGKHPVSRSTLAAIVNEAGRRGAQVIAVDLLLLDQGDSGPDAELVEALERTPAVIAAAATFRGGHQWIQPDFDDVQSQIPDAEAFLSPQQIFADVARVGMVNVATDATGSPRAVPLLFRAGDQIQAAMSLRVASVQTNADPEILQEAIQVGERHIPTDSGYLLPLNYYGPRGTIRSISAADVLAGKPDDGSLEGKVVVIGSTATGGGDVFPTPFDPVLPGVEVMATAIGNVLHDEGLLRDYRVRVADAAIGIVSAAGVVSLLGWRRSGTALVSIFAALLLLAAINQWAFANGVWSSAALPLAAALPPAILFGATQLWLNRNQAQLFEDQSHLLQRVQAPGLGDWLAEHPNFLVEPVQLHASIVFVDLSGFTGLTERAGPKLARDVLNEFHGLIDKAVTNSGGVVVSFMGDGVMILFGLPEAREDDPRIAVDCCVTIARDITGWLSSSAKPIGTLGFKIGAHAGVIVASRLGGDSQQHIAATGDVVNVASRLMEIAAVHQAELGISSEMVAAAGRESLIQTQGTMSGPVETPIRGRTEAMSVCLWRLSAASGVAAGN
jgi:adenylate cyclase